MERFERGGTGSLRQINRLVVVGLLLSGVAMLGVSGITAQEVGSRKAKVKVTPQYPELARRMKISGAVKVQAVVAPNGTIKETRVMGGHPVLASAVLDALQKWRFEPGQQETTENLEFRFDPNE